MQVEALQQARADPYERTDARKARRNGYKPVLKTRYGETMLKKPQFRDLPFETQVFGRYARVEKGTGERYRRIVLAGYLDLECSGDRCSSRDRTALSCLCFPDGQRPRRAGQGVSPETD